MIKILFIVMGLSFIGANCPAEGGLQFRIAFVDDPPFVTSWWPWSDDHLRVITEITNNSDTTYAIRKITPCNDCNPKIHVESVETGEAPLSSFEMDVMYIVRDESYLDMASGESYVDTFDIANYIGYEFEGDTEYRVWLEYRMRPGGSFKDTTRTTPIWGGTLVSDTLRFVPN